MRHFLLLILSTALLSSSLQAAEHPTEHFFKKPKLMVLMVIDQFRADYLTRFESRFLPAQEKKNGKLGGFNYLMQKGAYFPFGQYDILQSMTGPGHATVLTGAYPYQSGIPSNDWYDGQHDDWVYCAEDRSIPTIGATPKNPHIGTSPKNLIASTVGDELKNAGFPSRVVSIALKDRAAILMGGHRPDLAMWMDHETFHWVSSRFYLPSGKLPSWIEDLNKSLDQTKGRSLTWDPRTADGTGFSILTSGSVHQEKIGSEKSIGLPIGLDLTADAAERAVDTYHLGSAESTNRAPDLLAVSFSSHDLMGHAFGPNSREMEEMTVAEDKVISRLLNFLDKQVPGGMKNIVVVLTGDHGIPPNPDWLRENGFEAGRFKDHELAAKIEARIIERHGPPYNGRRYVGFDENLSFWFDRQALAARRVPVGEAEDDAKEVLSHVPGIAHVFTAKDVEIQLLPPGIHRRQIEHTYFGGRSGDVVAIPRPYFFSGGETTSHVTGYNYDRTVPIAFAGFGIHPGRYSRYAEVIDIAPTLSYLAGVLPPSLSEGHVIQEVTEKQ